MSTQSMHAHDHAEQAAIPVAHQLTHAHNHAEQAAIPVILSAHAHEIVQASVPVTHSLSTLCTYSITITRRHARIKMIAHRCAPR